MSVSTTWIPILGSSKSLEVARRSNPAELKVALLGDSEDSDLISASRLPHTFWGPGDWGPASRFLTGLFEAQEPDHLHLWLSNIPLPNAFPFGIWGKLQELYFLIDRTYLSLGKPFVHSHNK